ncbi:hypothetical protein ACFJIS_19055 [Variovorax boronicumulans]|uniref:hypothetical protein n=1 Tax=Variovorax boronicumulans TaxID=436515 RepID=UPI0036F2F6B1
MATIDRRVSDAQLRAHLQAANIPTPPEQDRMEVRVYAAYVTLAFMNDLIGPITYVFKLEPTMLFKVASLSPSNYFVGALFLAALVLMVPHCLHLIFMPNRLSIRWPRRLATVAGVISCLTWFYLAQLARPLDIGPSLQWLYGRQALESLGVSALFAISLNAQLLRRLHDWLIAR